MRRFLLVGLAAAFMMLRLVVIPTNAQTQATSGARALVTVPPYISVTPIQPVWDMSTVLTGSFSATVTWRIEANVQTIQMMLEASDLYRDDDPSKTEIPPIPLDTTKPAYFTGEFGRLTSGGGNQASWTGPGTPNSGFPTKQTETVFYQSSQASITNQLVSTQIYFDQQEKIKPTGAYSGRIKITALIPPVTSRGH